MGIVLLVLNLSGKTPVEMLRLKICESGWLISMAMFFRSLVLMPSMSELDLEINDWMVVTITAGETALNSSCGGSGLGGIKSSGFKEVGLTVSEIYIYIYIYIFQKYIYIYEQFILLCIENERKLLKYLSPHLWI
jgi:hypothetical protein